MIDSPAEIQQAFFAGFDKGVLSVGICGATSTPKWLMEQCRDFILNNTFASYNDFADVLNWPYAEEIFLALEILLLFAGVFVLCAFGGQLLFKEQRYAMTGGQRCAAVVTNIPMAIYLLYAVFEIVSGMIAAN